MDLLNVSIKCAGSLMAPQDVQVLDGGVQHVLIGL